MTQIMVCHEKHGVRYLDMTRGIGPVSNALLEERIRDGYWYGASDTHKAQIAASGINPRFVAWHFLYSRRNHEYERVEIIDLEKIA